jgi:hypothetical protein
VSYDEADAPMDPRLDLGGRYPCRTAVAARSVSVAVKERRLRFAPLWERQKVRNYTLKGQVLAEIIDGLPRIVDAILAAPVETRMSVMDAVLESYRKTALKILTARQAEDLLDEVVGHLRAEVKSR